MPARIVIVHDEAEYAGRVADSLREAGHDVASFLDPLDALNGLETADRVEVLVTRVTFGEGKQNGISLARMARRARPGLRVLFTGPPEFERYTEGLGELLPAPLHGSDLVEAVTRLLEPGLPED